ncbi:152_t:CDS:2, partial [Entrophospora sp. SA101]
MNALDRIQKSLQEISEYRQEVIQASNRSSTYDQDNLIYCQNLEKIVFNELKVEEYANKNKALQILQQHENENYGHENNLNLDKITGTILTSSLGLATIAPRAITVTPANDYNK